MTKKSEDRTEDQTGGESQPGARYGRIRMDMDKVKELLPPWLSNQSQVCREPQRVRHTSELSSLTTTSSISAHVKP